MLNTHLSQLILLSIEIHIAPISYKKQIESNTKQKKSPRVGIEPRSQNSKSKSLSIAPQSSLKLLGINSVPISNINTLLQTVTRIFKSRDWYY